MMLIDKKTMEVDFVDRGILKNIEIKGKSDAESIENRINHQVVSSMKSWKKNCNQDDKRSTDKTFCASVLQNSILDLVF